MRQDVQAPGTGRARASHKPLPPGGVIGIMGGGQLGRMTALAAARLGYRCHIYCPDANAPAAHVSDHATFADYDDLAALRAFATQVGVITFEFENVPAQSLAMLADRALIRPGVNALQTAQDRAAEKRFFNEIGIGTAPFAPVDSAADLTTAARAVGLPGILKTRRLGYDGKGQCRMTADTDFEEAFQIIGAAPAILEGFVDFDCEISVIVARGENGRTATFEPVENRHEEGILSTTRAPADIAPDTAREARRIAEAAADALDLVGLLAIEMFVLKDGSLLVNEMAPRPHNSGHWTIDACLTDQFEQFVRAICGLPLGVCERHSDAIMHNLIGEDVRDWQKWLAEPAARLHLYGKSEVRRGRKMGHVTRILPKGSLTCRRT